MSTTTIAPARPSAATERAPKAAAGAITGPPLPPLPLRHLRFTVFAVALPLIAVGAALLYRPGHDPLEWYLTVAWSLPILVTLVGLRGMARARRRVREAQAAPLPSRPGGRLTVVIPTIGTPAVLPALRRVVASAAASFPEFFDSPRIVVLTEAGAAAAEDGQLAGAEVVTVPAGYRTARGAIRKARAAQYALEQRIAAGRSGDHDWVLYLDDDTGAGPDTAIEVARFIKDNQDPKGLHLAQGVLTYPRHLAASRFTWLADAIRPGDDVTRFAAITGGGTPVAGMHGELLLVRGSVEAIVGWDYPNEVTEDSHFALRFAGLYPRRAGWFPARCYGSSPETVRAFVAQRARWSNGLARLVFDRSIPLRRRLFMAYCMSTWCLGPLQNVLLVMGVARLLHEPNLSPVAWPVIFAWSVNMAYIVWQYHTGLRINAQASGRRRPAPLDRVLVTVLIPVFALCEGAGGLTGAARHLRQLALRQERTFPVLAKGR